MNRKNPASDAKLLRRSRDPVSGPDKGSSGTSARDFVSERSSTTGAHGEAVSIDLDGLSEPIDPAELKEFEDGDWTQIEADPAFKDSLRGELWQLVDSLYGSGRKKQEDDRSDS